MLLAFMTLAAACAPNVHPVTLQALVRHESRANPYAIGVHRKAMRLKRQPTTLQEALATARDLQRRGIGFDAGLGQINVRNWKTLGLTVEQVFDPCTNLRATQSVLSDCYVRAVKRYPAGQTALHAALSCYNAGNFSTGFSNGYVANVVAQVGIALPAIRVQAVCGSIEPCLAVSRIKPAPDAAMFAPPYPD